MRKILLLILVLAFSSFSTLKACTYQLTLYDSYGDGWNGADIDVYINGSLLGTGGLASGSSVTYNITVSTGDVLDFVFNSGSWDSECSWEIFDADGNTVCVGSPSTSDCDGTVVSCPVIGSPCAITDCSDATNIASLPYSLTGQTTCDACYAFDETDACGSEFMNGMDEVYRYTPSSDGWVDILAETAESDAGAERAAAVFLLDGCPSNVASNCIASSTIQYPSHHGSPHIIVNLTAGVTYYIVVSNGIGVYNADPCIDYDLYVSNIAQPAPTDEDCFGATPICNSFISEGTPGNGQGNYPSEINSSTSCLEGERNGNWYTFTVEAGGTMTVDIVPTTLTDDYDFALYNVTSGGCQGIFSGASPEVSCNYAMVDGDGDTGINSSVSENDYESTITVSAGETYMLYVSQWTVSTSGYSITLGGGAGYIDLVGPELSSADQPNCAQNEVVVHFSENVDCSTIDLSDFTFSNPAGSSLSIASVSSSICDAGGSFTDQVVLTLSGNITVGGTYSIGLNAGAITDQCTHTTPAGSTPVTFTIVTPTVNAGAGDPTICVGQTLSLNETGGSSTSWSWTGPNGFTSTNQNPNISSATTAATGNYTVVGTIDATGCFASDIQSVTVSALPVVTANANSNPVCLGSTVTLTGGGANSYAWSGGVSNGVAFTPSLGTTTYQVTGTNTSTGCANTASINVVVNPLPTVTATASATNLCEGTSLTLTGGGANNYSWSGGAVNGVAFVPAVGSYTYTVTGTNTTTTCQNTASVSVTVNDAPEVSAGSDDDICANETYTLSGSYGGGASSATWSTSGTGLFSSTTSQTAVYTPSAFDISGGSVTLTYTTNDPAGACTAIADPMHLTINPMENASFSYGSGTYCTTAADPTPTITGVSGGTFSAPAGLSINSSSGLIDVSASTIGGPYTVTYTTPGTCSSTSTFDITITSGADATFSYPTTPICSSAANPIPTFPSGAGAGVFSNSSAVADNLFFVDVATGVINLANAPTGTDIIITNTVNLGVCGSDAHSFTIHIDEAATIEAGANQTLCESALSYGLSGASVGGSAGSITWTTSGDGSFASASNINTNYVFGATDLGAITLTVTTDDPAGVCPAVSDQIVLTIQDAAEVYAGADHAICAGQTYTLSGTSGGSTSNISWSTSGTGTFNDNTSLTATYTPSAADISAHSVVLTISSDDPAGACGIVTDPMTLTINPLPTVTAGSNSPICQGATLNLTTTGNATAWVWTGGYNPADVQNPTHANALPSESGVYTVVGTITATGCSAQSTVNVTINPKPTVTAGSNSPICAGATLNLTASGSGADAWVWSSTSSYNPADIQNPTHTNSLVAESGTYTVVGTISATGCSASSNVSVVVNALPTVTANASDNTVCEGTAVTLTGGGANSYVWNNSVSNGVAFIPPLGTTNYSVTGTNTTTSCSNTANINVIVSPMPTVSAGSDDAICANETYTLNGSYGGGASSATWSSSGDGSFNNNTPNAIYTPAGTDIPAVGGAPVNVTLTYTTNDPASDCNAQSDDMVLTINAMDLATFNYASGTYCNTASDPTPTITGLAGGTFTSSPAGLVIDGFTGVIDCDASAIGGPYTVTYTTNGTCPNSSTFNINISSGADAEFSYPTPICSSAANPIPSHATGSNGTYSDFNTTGNLTFVNAGTGEIDLSSTLPGTYTIQNEVDLGTCGSDIQTFNITIDEAATFNAGSNATVCSSDLDYTLSGATIGGSATNVNWTTTGTGTFNDATALNPIYTFGLSDVGTTVTLKATTDDPGTSCGAVSDSILLTINIAAVVGAGPNDTICAGQTYTVHGSLSGSTSSVTWTTSGNGSFVNSGALTTVYTPSADDITAGSVTLTISSNDPSGPCGIVSDDMLLLINPVPSVIAGANTPICEENTLILSETGAQADAWQWTGSNFYTSTNQNPNISSVSISATGTYTVVGTISATGCSSTATVDVLVNPNPTVTAGIIANNICANENIELTETGAEADTWNWVASNGYNTTDQNPTIYNATSDTSAWYIVTGTISTTGCASTDSVNVNVYALPTVGYTVSDSDTAICIGESVILTGAGTASSYTWNNGVNNGISFSPSITQTYQVIGEDANGCKDSVQVEVVVNPLPNVFAGNDQNVPYGSTTTLNESSPAGLSYSWAPADSLDNPSLLHPVTVPLHISNQFILEATDPATGCSDADTMIVYIIGGPLSVQVFAVPNDSICYGESHRITALTSGGGTTDYHYNWTSVPPGVYPDTSILVLDTVLVTTTYYLEVEEGGVNYANDTVTITVLPKPVINDVIVTDLSCFGNASGSILIDAVGTDPLSYSIDNASSFVNDSLFENLSAGTGFITVVKNIYGCITKGDTVDITQPALLNVTEDYVIDASCGNDNGSVGVNVTGGTTPYFYTWNNADITNVSDSLYEGTYTMTVTDANNCTDTLQYTIANLGGGILSIVSVSDVNCYGQSTGTITVAITNGYPVYDFIVAQNSVPLDSIIGTPDSSYIFTGLSSGNYTIYSREGAGCYSSKPAVISSNPEITFDFSVTNLPCYQMPQGAIDATVYGGVSPFQYQWTGPGAFTAISEDINNIANGDYVLRVIDSLNCMQASNIVSVSQPGEPDVYIALDNSPQCFGYKVGHIIASGIGGTQPYDYKWTNGTWTENGSELDSLTAGTYHLLLKDVNNCLIADTTVILESYEQIVVSDSIYYVGTHAGIALEVSGGTPAYNYNWTDEMLNNISSESVAEQLISGFYFVTVTDFYGCEFTNFYEIDIELFIPNLITPNADGYNDTWKIADIESYESISIQIFNRWGNVVYSFDGSGAEYSDEANQFDGTYDGKELPIGSYIYILDLKDGEGAHTGTLSIMRARE
ncbi:MAG: gliding motility-associated C-terminal domain-containing protein [Bacteroidales bacterium]|nr:gliding motility-associated C-terminal domain-containing protein [Bacteroidales bacterium]